MQTSTFNYANINVNNNKYEDIHILFLYIA